MQPLAVVSQNLAVIVCHSTWGRLGRLAKPGGRCGHGPVWQKWQFKNF